MVIEVILFADLSKKKKPVCPHFPHLANRHQLSAACQSARGEWANRLLLGRDHRSLHQQKG